jgi:hypothetical protein
MVKAVVAWVEIVIMQLFCCKFANRENKDYICKNVVNHN